MTTVNLPTIAQAIEEIDLSAYGIHSKGPDTIPTSGITECPYFAPRPRQFISDMEFTRETFGTNGAAKMTLRYTMNWQYFHAPIGTVLTFQSYGNMLVNLAYILEQIADNDTPEGAIDVQLLGVTDIAPIQDAAGGQFHGVELAFRVEEYING